MVDDTAFYVAVGVLGGASVLCIIAVSIIIFYLKHLQEQIVALKKVHNERPNQWEKEEAFDYTSVQNDFNPPQIPRLDYNTTAVRTPENAPQQMNWPGKPNVDKPWLRPQQSMQNTPAPAPQVFPKWKTSAVQQAPSESSRMDYRQQPSRFPAQPQNFGRNPMSGSDMDRMGY